MTAARHLLVAGLVLALAAPCPAIDTTELIVKYRAGAPDTAAEGLQSLVASDRVSPWSGSHVYTLAAGVSAEDAARRFAANPWVELAEPNGRITASFIPDDPLYSPFQWNMDIIGMPAAWDITRGSPSTVIAVIDTGVAYENNGKYKLAPDLAGTTFVQGYDFVNNDTHPNDDEGHGTHVTGTIAQTTNNAYGVAGIANQCAIMPLKVLDADGSGSFSALADALYYAADHGAKVVNMSLGAPVPSSAVEDALNYAHSKGVTLVAATGNDNALGAGAINWPAAYSTTIAVGATRFDNHVTWYSNKGPQIDLVAPGGDLNVDQNDDGYGDGILQNDFNLRSGNLGDFGYWFLTGTSMATPHVTGVAALIYDLGVHDPELIRTILHQTARDLEAPGFDNDTGWGLLNAAAALELASTFPHPGDANRDGKVDGADLAIWQQYYDPLGLGGDNDTWEHGDWNGDRRINGGDLALWQQNYAPLGYLNWDSPLAGPSGSGLLSASDAEVPEPSTLALLATAASMLLLRRRR